MMNQKEAVFKAVTNVCGDRDGAYSPSKEERAQVNQILFEGFRAGKIQLDKEFSDPELKAYVSGLQSNWLRKDKRLNGGVTYIAKNPGSRQGSSDPQLKALRALISTLTPGTDDHSEVQGYIDARLSEIAATRQTKVVDFSSLPEELRIKFQK